VESVALTLASEESVAHLRRDAAQSGVKLLTREQEAMKNTKTTTEIEKQEIVTPQGDKGSLSFFSTLILLASYPSIIIANSTSHFGRLFKLLQIGDRNLQNEVWKLLSTIPTCQSVRDRIHMKNISEETCYDSKFWDVFFPNNTSTLLYSLQIVDALLFPLNDEERVDLRLKWCRIVLYNGGFERLVHLLLSLTVDEEEKMTFVRKKEMLILLLKIIEYFFRALIPRISGEMEESSFTRSFRAVVQGTEEKKEVAVKDIIRKCMNLLNWLAKRKERVDEGGVFVSNVMSILTLGLFIKPDHLDAFYDSEEFDDIFTTLLLHSNDLNIKRECGRGLFLLCTTLHESLRESNSSGFNYFFMYYIFSLLSKSLLNKYLEYDF